MRIELISLALLATALPAAAAPTEVESRYLDLVYGSCFKTLFGQTARETPIDPKSQWKKVEGFQGSEATMNSEQVKSAVDLRAWTSDKGDILVDVANTKICWSQASSKDPGSIAARVRLFALDHAAKGVVLDEGMEKSDSGTISRLTVIGMTNWTPDVVPILIIREIVSPKAPSITVQVIRGDPNSKPPQ